MNIGLIALLSLLVVVAIGFIKKANVGILAIAAAVILGYCSGKFSAKAIISGFNASLFMTLLGVTYFFGVVQSNGCLEIFIKKIVNSFGKKIWIIPILMYVVGWVVAGVGPGCVPAMALVATIGVPLAHQSGYNPVMLLMIGNIGTYSGRFTPLTPEGIVVSTLLDKQNIHNISIPILINTIICSVILAIFVFFAFKGYKVKASVQSEANDVKTEKLTKNQIITLVSILVMVSLVIFVKMDVGLASFLIATILVIFGVANESEAFKKVPWRTLIMVTGVSTLMKMVIDTGGIDILAKSMSKMMVPATAPAIAGLVAGCMNFFSSTIGVIFPTFVPTVGAIVKSVGGGVSAVSITSAIAIFASFTGISPVSGGGAFVMAACKGDPQYSKEIDANKLFMKLFVWAFIFLVLLTIMALAGIFKIVG